MSKTSDHLWAVTSAVGTGLSFLVLVVIAVMYAHRTSRVHLDRVSFRLMLYSLIANMFFGLFGTICGYFTGPSPGCALSLFILQLSLQISSFLPFCIALNLQLVVVHGVRWKHLEKYYAACSVVMALAITIPPYAAGQYGWDPLELQCWYTNHVRQQRIAWQIGAQLIWTGLTVIGEVSTACMVVTYMFRAHLRRKRVLSVANSSMSSVSGYYRHKTRSQAVSSDNSLKPMAFHANTYANVIFRIALYPLVSFIINLTSIGTVIHSTSTNGIQNANDYRILLLSDFLYGGRAIVYALLAATDLSLLRAVRAFVAHLRGCKWGSTATIRSNTFTGTSRTRRDDLVVQVELSTVVARDAANGGSSASDSATDSKERNLTATREASSLVSADGEAVDKAERGILVCVDPSLNTDNPPLMPPRAIAFELSSPITRTQSMRHRWEQAAREQAQEDEFMRII
ncbi:unnamed protein product [Peniophora sp. CBMAI 1063]|nr:unnamed protein product [Peniophora sp. CBMAI 1063]